MEFKECIPDYGLEYLGIHSLNEVHWNLTTPALYEFAIRRYEGKLARLFEENFQQFSEKVPAHVKAAGPRIL